ncbi:c(7)-type cytochrome triheme domain-containing protein [Ramlibacter albus]|uniref:Cytochrome c7-like domain-containing protein n=1 Tax=Ramlibacter albus TaxID=2079448 RepID=A0A923S4V8_9BURK|nr:c(7)-type cytochrome triheme domain-containing protein [Ramlibacter albus]MBC5767303.1 hypothetical protein [Ramlibacter albus]
MARRTSRFLLAALLAAAAGLALAQVHRADLFGSLPEAPTERQAVPVHDAALPEAKRLQAPHEAFAGLPQDRQGKPDWVRSLRQRSIEPRATVTGKPRDAQPSAPDVVMKNTAQMPWVNFPHAAHGDWLACQNCHDSLFAPKAGAASINMTTIFRGEACGVCHGTVAFTPMAQCERCHSVPQPGQKPWW